MELWQGNEVVTANLNKAQLIGFLGEDPKSADMQRGGTVVTLSVGTTEYWKEQGSGERKSATEWHRVVIFNEALGKTAMSYLRKGSAVYVEGTIRSRRYTDRHQVERKVTEIVVPKFGGSIGLMDRRRDNAGGRADADRGPAGIDQQPDLDDEVPF